MKRKTKQYRWILLGLTLVWMAVIFGFSAQPAEESAKTSHSVGEAIGQTFVPGYRDWTKEEQKEFAKGIDYPVRKCGHASEYAMLGMLCLGTLMAFGHARGKAFVLALPIGIFYAASDEFHQLFVPGRSGQITDVMIDVGGFSAGMLLLLAVGAVRAGWKMRHRDKIKEQ